MTKNAVLLAIGVVLLGALPAAGQNLSSEDALRVTHETLMQAVNSANVQRVSAIVHPRALGFFRTSQQLVQLGGSTDTTSVVQGILADLGEFTTGQTSLGLTLRVVGDTDIVTQTAVRQVVVSKKKVTHYLRTTAIYVDGTDGWKLLSWHTSDIPLEKK